MVLDDPAQQQRDGRGLIHMDRGPPGPLMSGLRAG
jgi:hypothetical protein